MGQAVDTLGLTGTTIEQVQFDACVDSGGFGLVYRGKHLGLGEDVAIKCLRIHHLIKGDDSLRESIGNRFRDETRLLYRLSQGNLDIVRCISSGTLVAPSTSELTPYMVLEWLDGCTLSTDIRERRDRMQPPRTLEETVALMDSAVNALAYAHGQGVVHRDVKPGNLFLKKTREGVRMKVLDFGLAKILSDESIGIRPTAQTAMGVHFCSPSYGAPEQFTPNVGPIGPWTDIYSLALVLLEVMKGDKIRPAGNLADGLMKALDAKTGSPRASALGLTLPPAIEDLLHRAVAQNPNERPRDAAVFWSALRELMQRNSVGPIPSSKAAPQLLATAYDDNVAAAMAQVRAATATAKTSVGSGKASPFAGTMMMPNAPRGAPHMPPSQPPPVTSQPPSALSQHPQSHAPNVIINEDPLLMTAAPSTAPMAPPMAPRSPLAASLGPGKHGQPQVPGSVAPPPMLGGPITAPIPLPQQQPPAMQPPPPQMHAPMQPATPAQPMPAHPSIPPQHDVSQHSSLYVRPSPSPTTTIPPKPPASKGSSIAIAIVVFFIIVLGGGAGTWWFMIRGK